MLRLNSRLLKVANRNFVARAQIEDAKENVGCEYLWVSTYGPGHMAYLPPMMQGEKCHVVKIAVFIVLNFGRTVCLFNSRGSLKIRSWTPSAFFELKQQVLQLIQLSDSSGGTGLCDQGHCWDRMLGVS